MSEKNVNRIVAFVILVLLGDVFLIIARHLVTSFFEAGPLSVGSFPYIGGILLASVLFFLMFYTVVLDIISGQTHKYPEG